MKRPHVEDSTSASPAGKNPRLASPSSSSSPSSPSSTPSFAEFDVNPDSSSDSGSGNEDGSDGDSDRDSDDSSPSSFSTPSFAEFDVSSDKDNGSEDGSDGDSDRDSDDSSSSSSSSQSKHSTDLPIDESDPNVLPEGVKLYNQHTLPPPKELNSYFQQRYRLFSKYDDGVWLTDKAWFEVTPEKVAKGIAEHIFHPHKNIHTILDAFCGIGGNTIQFALQPTCEHVIAVDSDPIAIACAKHNAHIYGVAHKITFLVADFFMLVRSRYLVSAEAIFLSPPWGGPQYRAQKVFNLENLSPYPFSTLYEAASTVSPNMAFFLPRSSDLNQLAQYVKDEEMVQAVHYCLDWRSKAVCVYWGRLAEVDIAQGREKKGEEGEVSSIGSKKLTVGENVEEWQEVTEVERSAEEVWERVAGVVA